MSELKLYPHPYYELCYLCVDSRDKTHDIDVLIKQFESLGLGNYYAPTTRTRTSTSEMPKSKPKPYDKVSKANSKKSNQTPMDRFPPPTDTPPIIDTPMDPSPPITGTPMDPSPPTDTPPIIDTPMDPSPITGTPMDPSPSTDTPPITDTPMDTPPITDTPDTPDTPMDPSDTEIYDIDKTDKHKYIKSFGFEFETGRVILLTKKTENTFTPYLQCDDRHVVSLGGEPFINKKEIFEITADSALGDTFYLNKHIRKTFKLEYDGPNKVPNKVIKMRQTKDPGTFWPLDQLEFIYTLPVLNEPIGFLGLLERSCSIRTKIVDNFLGEGSKYYDEGDDYKVYGHTFTIYEPRGDTFSSLPSMIVNAGTDNFNSFTVQATVAIEYENIILFMQPFFKDTKMGRHNDYLVIIQKTMEGWFISVDFFKDKEGFGDLINWISLKFFYSILDINYLINIKTKTEDEPIIKTIDSVVSEYIKNQYIEWIGKNTENIDAEIQQGNYDFRRTLVQLPETKVEDEDEDIYFIGKNHLFCIRHSLYDVLYKKLGLEKCIEFLNLIKGRFEQIKRTEIKLSGFEPEQIKITEIKLAIFGLKHDPQDLKYLSYLKYIKYLEYFIVDIEKGILYFEKMKETKMDLATFAQYYDPDLSMELNYDTVQTYTKHRVKKYPFLTESTTKLQANVLLFEIRNFNNMHNNHCFPKIKT